MNNRWTPMCTVWALRSGVLLVAVMAAAGLPAATAGATTPPPAADTGGEGWHVTIRPAAQIVREGQTAIFTASFTPTLTSGSSITVRWQTAPAPTGPWSGLAGPGGPVLAIAATRSMDGDLFQAVASTDRESSSSPPVILHLQEAPNTAATTTPSIAALICPSPPPSPPIGPDAPCTGPIPASLTPSVHPTTPPVPAASTTPPVPAASTTPAATAATPDSGAALTTGTQYGTVALPVLQLGQEQCATGHNFTPGTLVTVTLEPDGIDLGTYPVAPDGTVTTHFATTNLLAGTHTVRWTSA
jgi:hypothetical protein